METITNGSFTGERALFHAHDLIIRDSVFSDGESPLKHSGNIEVYDTAFNWRYPVWYSHDAKLHGCTVAVGARAGMWYTDRIVMRDSTVAAPKCFRRCNDVLLENVSFPDGPETLWDCHNVKLRHVTANGDYFGMNCSDMDIDDLQLTGHYHFDGVRNVTIRNSRLITKDTFWNSENVLVENSYISGEYIGWNSKDLTFVDCTIESLQGLCYIENLVIRRCRFVNTTLAFEYSTVDADITGGIDSVINPSGGIIRADSIGELILEEDRVDVSRTKIILNGKSRE